MGGYVTTGQQQQNQNTNQNQTSTTTPWTPGASTVSGILGNVGGVNPQLNATQQGAIGQLTNLGAAGNPYQGSINNVTNSLLGGGGATSQAPLMQGAYQQYAQQLAPYTQSSFLNPMNTPGFSDALSAMNSDITNQVNSAYASAGRAGSGMNTQQLARGLSQGEGQLIANQYNQNVGNQLGAMGSLYGAGNTTGGLLTGLGQTYLQNQQAGINATGAATAAQQYGPLLELQAQSQATGIPLQVLAQQMGIALPATQAFGTTTGIGQGTNQGTTQNQAPLWQQMMGGAIGTAGLLGATGAFGSGGTAPSGVVTNPGWLTGMFK